MKLRILWRGRRFSPLFVIGKYTLWFHNGITFGRVYNPKDITYYCGWLIICKETKFHHDFVKGINMGTWPKDRLWIVKYSQAPKLHR